MNITVQQLKQALADLPEWDDEATRDKNIIYIPVKNGEFERPVNALMFVRNPQTKYWEIAI